MGDLVNCYTTYDSSNLFSVTLIISISAHFDHIQNSTEYFFKVEFLPSSLWIS